MILFFYRLLFVFSVLAVLCVTSSALAATYTVTKTADTNDGTCDSDCSLREAITAANGASGNTVEFNIDGGTDGGCTGAGGVCTISPTSALPSITAASMTINGYTQNSAAVNSAAFPNALNTTLKIVINGASAGSVSGLTISNVANCVIKGLAINGFAAKGIVITGSSATGNKIQGNFVGTDVTGETDSGNTSHGVWITSSSTANIIGTDGDGSNDNAERNLLSGNNAAGINMDTNCGSNTIAGNFIGTDKDGTTDLGNSGNGIVTNSGANSNFIGTDGDGTSDAVEGNVVSGNDTNGFNLVSNSNIIAGNLIGVNAAGTGAVKNGQAGISMSGNSNRIGTNGDGTSDTNERNVIGGHSTSPNRGVIGSGTGVIVAGNYIGIGSDGSTDLGNNRGIQIQADGWRIGTNGDGTADSAEANVISGNSTGVYVDTGGTNAVVAGNLIGLNAAGTSAVANDTAGIAVIASANNNSRIGTNADGTADSAERNIISGNGIGIGIENGATGVVVAGNYIGVDVNGNTAVANTQGIVLGKWDGSTAGSSNRIGTNGDGTNDTAERNVISGNTTGIEITNGSSNTIAGNYVGVGADGTTDVGNAGHGITFTNSGGSSNTIGGDIAAEANTIAYNGDASGEYGVRVAVAGSDGNDILRNSFFNNQDIGIKLNGDGANNDQAAPSITDQGTSGSDITLVGTSTASATVQIFEADSNSQEGKTWLGEATANGSGDWTFTLTAPYNEDGRIFVATATDATNGTSQFSASFTLANTTPVASSQTVTPDEDTSVTITLGLTDADGDTLTTTIVTLPASGALYQTADGATLGTAITSAPTNVTDSSRRVIYVPVANANGNGIGNFTFRGSDGLNTSNTATVTVNVTAVADSPTAAAQTVSLNEDTAKSITLAGSDPDGGSLTYAIVSNPSHGTLSGLNAGTGAVTYTPTANYNGTDAFSFWVYDGTTHSGAALVNLTISAVNDPPTASAQSVTVTESSTVITLSAVDVESSSLTFAIVSNPSHGALSALNASSGTVTYTPTTGYGGSDSFTFKANDGSADSSTATVRLTVDLSSATNHPPSVFAGTDFSAVEGAPSVLLGVATDEDGDSLTYLWSQSTGQTVSLTNTDQAKAAFTAPAPDGSGDLEFVLSVSDGTATATDSVRVRLARRNFTANDAALVNGRVAAASGGMVITREEGVDYKGREATAIDLGGGSVLYSSGSMPVGVVTLENAIVAADPGWRNNAGVVVMIDPAVLDEGTVIDLNNPKFAEKGGVIASYGNQDGNLFGYVVKTADVDGDGSSEILALAPGTSYGTLYVLSGDNLETRNMVLGSASEELKTSVLFTTDVNGADGDDLLIGLSTGGGAALTSSKGDRLLASVSPSASVWNGILGGSDLPTVYDLSAVEADFVVTAEGEVASADGGDLDGSGSEDLVLSASGEFGVDVIFGSSAVGDSVTSLSSANRLTTADSSLGPNDSAAVGDVTGDGYDDIVLGFSTAVGGKGKIVVVPGRSSWDANAYDIDYGIAINGLSGDAIGEWLILDDADGDGVVDIYTNAGTSGDSYLITLGSLIDEEAGGSGGGSDEEGGHLGPGGFGGCSLNNRSATIRSRRLLSSANTSWRIAVFLIATLIYSLWLRLLRLAMFTKVRSDSRWNLKTSTKTELLPVKISLFIFFVLTLISCGSARIPGSGDEAEEGGAGGSLPEEGEVFLTLTGKITQPTVDAELEALSKGMKGLIPRGFAVKRATASPNVACSVYDLGGAYLGGVTTGETGDFATTVAVSDTSDDATARIVVSCENGIHNFAETSLTEADLSAGSADGWMTGAVGGRTIPVRSSAGTWGASLP
ncbi:MAG: tandem-95 repeat protein [Deltaproteobacteria bacterium]|nr:tandem-95 repeat protein [Deltaproteobacteria bacterium]